MRAISRILLACTVAAAGAVALPGAAQAATKVDGYVWADQPALADYVVTNPYRRNSTGGNIEIRRSSAGSYSVRFAGMASAGGVAHVRPYGTSNTAACVLVEWRAAGTDEVLAVRCYDAAGRPADTLFTASFTNRPAPTGTFAYLFADQPSTAFGVPYTPSARYAYDSTGTTPQVWRQDVGVYMMIMGTVDTHYTAGDHLDGFYEITPVNKRAVRCEVHGENDETPTPIAVFCADVAGVPVDTAFTVTYAHSRSVQGAGLVAANALLGYSADDPVGSWSVWGYWNAGGAPVFTRWAAGRYTVTFPGLSIAAGHAVTGARGTPSAYCVVESWFPDGANVDCFDRTTNTAVDAEFGVAMTA